MADAGRMSKESPLRTVATAALVAIVCSLLVATAVSVLRPYERAYAHIERNRAILETLGLVQPEESLDDSAIVDRFVGLDVRLVDLETGAFVGGADGEGFDVAESLQFVDRLVPIATEADVGGLGSRLPVMPVYMRVAEGRLEQIALPIVARGMWSTIFGVVALEADLQTIAGVDFYAHGETPGIGDRIQNEQWRASWRGRRLYADDGSLAFAVTANPAAAAAINRVDAITGATVTATAVGNAMRYWFSDDGYRRFLDRLAAEGL